MRTNILFFTIFFFSIPSFSQTGTGNINYWKAIAVKYSNWDFSVEKQGEWTNWKPLETNTTPIIITVNNNTNTIEITNKGGVKLSILSRGPELTETVEGKRCYSYNYKAVDMTGLANEKCDVTLRLFEDTSMHILISYGKTKVAYSAIRLRDNN
jgi:hypothetical protein